MVPERFDASPGLRSRLWRSRSDKPGRPVVPRSAWALETADASCCGAVATVSRDGPRVRPDDGAAADADLSVDEPALPKLPDGGVNLDAISFRRAASRSPNDPRDALLLSETPGEAAWGADLVRLSLPIRLPALSDALGLPTSDGCGRLRGAAISVFGENRKVLEENDSDRGEPMLGAELRGLGTLGLKLCAGARLAGGVKEGRDGADGVENDLAPLNGLDGIVGADLG